MNRWFRVAVVALSVTALAVPIWAQHGKGKGKGHAKAVAPPMSSQAQARSNKGGEVRGKARAAEVRSMNTKAGGKTRLKPANKRHKKH